MQFDIVSIGAPLVEIIGKHLDREIFEVSDFTGPFPSGDTPIFINAAALLGKRCGFIGVVGDDAFGQCFIRRFLESGVDMSGIRVSDTKATGVTFVSYFSDGSRQFLYHQEYSAAGELSVDDIDIEYIKNTGWFHFTGFGLSGSSRSRDAVVKCMENLPSCVKVSFDPNIREEALSLPELREIAMPFMERADLVFPSGDEAAAILGAPDNQTACRILQDKGKTVIHKLGKEGCVVYGTGGIEAIPGFKVEEIDPTGAGDTFAAAFISALSEGKSCHDSAVFANAAAALSVTRKGPMEGAPTKEQVLEFLAANKPGVTDD